MTIGVDTPAVIGGQVMVVWSEAEKHLRTAVERKLGRWGRREARLG
jgi:hypothetical protein